MVTQCTENLFKYKSTHLTTASAPLNVNTQLTEMPYDLYAVIHNTVTAVAQYCVI